MIRAYNFSNSISVNIDIASLLMVSDEYRRGLHSKSVVSNLASKVSFWHCNADNFEQVGGGGGVSSHVPKVVTGS